MHAQLLQAGQVSPLLGAQSLVGSLSVMSKLELVLQMATSSRRQNKSQRSSVCVWYAGTKKKIPFLRAPSHDSGAADGRGRPHLPPPHRHAPTDDVGHAPLPIAISKSNFEVTFVRFISSGQGRNSEGERKERRKEKREGEEGEEGRKKY